MNKKNIFYSEAKIKQKKYFFLSGIVKKGTQISRKINFPTANLIFDPMKRKLPKNGCYVTFTKLEEKYYYGLTCIIPTKNQKILCETWFQNFKQNLYGKKITIFFMKFYRENKPYVSLENMKKLIKKDLENLVNPPKIQKEMLK